MNRTLLATFIGTSVLASSAYARPELNAFINRPANTIPELIAQMRSDPVVMDRFMRHFSMTRSEVLAYVGSLRLGVIPKSGYYTVYSVPEGGQIKVHKSFFKAGTPAFVDRNGRPILRIKCGNPFVAGPMLVSSPGPKPVEPEIALQPIEDSVVYPSTPELSSLSIPEVPEEIPVADVDTPTLPTEPSFQPTPQPILATLAGLGAAISFAGSGRSDRDNPPVPEPATLLVVGSGVAMLARRRRRK